MIPICAVGVDVVKSRLLLAGGDGPFDRPFER